MELRFSSDTPINNSSPIQSSSSNPSAASSPRLGPIIGIPKRATTLDVPGLTKSKVSPDGRIASRDVGAKLVIVMVGLPARGKSYIVRKIARYYSWLGHRCKVFNVGEKRRSRAFDGCTASFFDSENEDARKAREAIASETLEELLYWIIHCNGTVGIFDATNSSIERRLTIIDRIKREPHLKVLFIESICTDAALLEVNMRLKLRGPDYKDKDSEKSLEDFRKRVAFYEKQYTSLGEIEENIPDMQYCKVINVGKKLVSYNINGFLAAQAIYFLLNLNLKARLICIARHGESTDNALGKIGGDAPLSDHGVSFAKDFAKFIDQKRIEFRNSEIDLFNSQWSILPVPGEKAPVPGTAHHGVSEFPTEKSFSVWTSLLQRSCQTVQYFDEDIYDIKGMKMLDEISCGIFDGMSHEEIKAKYPESYNARMKDQLNFRFPGIGGESYMDVVHRLNSVIVEVERMDHHVLIISHRVTTRILLAYYLGLDPESICKLDVLPNTVYILEPKPYGTECNKYRWDPSTGNFNECKLTALEQQNITVSENNSK